MVRRGFGLIVSREPDLEVVGEAQNGLEAIELVRQLEPDIIVLDVSMPECNGMEAARKIGEISPKTRILALSMHRDGVYVREMLRAGARGYLVKDADDETFLQAIRAVARGDAYISPSVADTVLTDYRRHVTNPVDLLTAREREVLQKVAEGLTNKEIANLLGLSVYTVEAHRGKIMEKLNLHNTGDIVRFALRNGLIT
jgi:DNA-binding NarL/FixJ family response regulator